MRRRDRCDGKLTDEATQGFIRQLLENLVTWTRASSPRSGRRTGAAVVLSLGCRVRRSTRSARSSSSRGRRERRAYTKSSRSYSRPIPGTASHPDQRHGSGQCLYRDRPLDAVKYELDKVSGHLRVDARSASRACARRRRLHPADVLRDVGRSALRVADGTHGIRGDGDPLDICVSPNARPPTATSSCAPCRSAAANDRRRRGRRQDHRGPRVRRRYVTSATSRMRRRE